MVLTLIYPSSADNNIKKMAVLQRLQRKLHLTKLDFIQKYNDGDITLQQLNNFRRNWLQPRKELIKQAMPVLKESMMSQNWNYSFEQTFKVTDAGITIDYPVSANNMFMRYFFLMRQKKKLEITHNKWGEEYRNGDITKEQWLTFKERWWKPRWMLVKTEILKYRDPQKNVSWGLNYDQVFVEV